MDLAAWRETTVAIVIPGDEHDDDRVVTDRSHRRVATWRRLRIRVLAVSAVGSLAVVVLAGANLLAGGETAPTAPTVTTVLGRLPSTTAPGVIGEKAPDFAVETTGNDVFELSAHLLADGRPVLLNLWASWCFPCREEMPALDAASRARPDVKFVGVAIRDSESDALEFLEQVPVSYVVGIDDGSVEEAYAPLAMPETYLISAEGIIVKRLFGGLTEERLAAELAEAFG